MKASIIRSTLHLGVVLTLSTGLAGPAAIAGPGLDYWRNLGQAGNSAPKVNPATIADAARQCTDSRAIVITESKPLFPNGRGPTRTVEVGRKFVCTSCDSPMIAMKPSGDNGRGAMTSVAIAGVHDCNGCAPGHHGASVN
jgi:hypothetical protein